jgi:glucose-6-phosphate dehydrogenase assembly protein OpcA
VAETSSLADRVVVDMAWRETECHDVWPRMPALGKYVSDLAWDRIRGFRRAIAEYFSSASARRILADLASLRVETRPGHPTPEAAYLLTWVLGCMGYRRSADGRNPSRSWQKDGTAVEAGFVAAPGLPSGAEVAAGESSVIQAIEFRGGGSAVRFALQPEAAATGHGDGDTETILVPCVESDTALLSDEMVVEHRRRTFEHHLEQTIQLFEEPAYFADK